MKYIQYDLLKINGKRTKNNRHLCLMKLWESFKKVNIFMLIDFSQEQIRNICSCEKHWFPIIHAVCCRGVSYLLPRPLQFLGVKGKNSKWLYMRVSVCSNTRSERRNKKNIYLQFWQNEIPSFGKYKIWQQNFPQFVCSYLIVKIDCWRIYLLNKWKFVYDQRYFRLKIRKYDIFLSN